MTTKERILQLFNNESAEFEASSYDIYERLGDVSSDTVDRNLKEMVEAGTLIREKQYRFTFNGYRKVYCYRLPATTPSASALNEEEISDMTVSSDGSIETPQSGPRPIFIVRDNTNYRSSFDNWAIKFARTLQPFDRSGRVFRGVGQTVVSLMISDASKENIIGAIENANLNITYEVVESLGAAIECIKYYSPDTPEHELSNFEALATRYISQYASQPAMAGEQSAPLPQSEPKTPMQKFADREYETLTQAEMLEVLSVLAKDYIERTNGTH
jgi:hypothetical protein